MRNIRGKSAKMFLNVAKFLYQTENILYSLLNKMMVVKYKRERGIKWWSVCVCERIMLLLMCGQRYFVILLQKRIKTLNFE